MMQCTQGSVPEASQKEIAPNLRQQGFFLCCQCIPENDIKISTPESDHLYICAELIDKQQLSPQVYRYRLQTAVPVYYHAGQFVNVKRTNGVTRSYSLASLPSEDNYIEFHVKRMPNGEMSNWMADEFNVSDSIEITGPMGSCFYLNDMSAQPILLVGSGTGLAPLIGVVRDALHNNHTNSIHIYHGAFNEEELYLDKEINELAKQHDNVHYKACITSESSVETIEQGRACEVALLNHPDLKGWQVFLCGAPSLVKFMQQQAYLKGAAMQDIHTDPFETNDLREQDREDTP